MKVTDILFEGITDTVYHYTPNLYALSILIKDRFELRTDIATKSETDLRHKDNMLDHPMIMVKPWKYSQFHKIMNLHNKIVIQNQCLKQCDIKNFNIVRTETS